MLGVTAACHLIDSNVFFYVSKDSLQHPNKISNLTLLRGVIFGPPRSLRTLSTSPVVEMRLLLPYLSRSSDCFPSVVGRDNQTSYMSAQNQDLLDTADRETVDPAAGDYY